MLVPYNVDRPARRTPYVTYALMGLNVFIYLLCVIHANLVLPSEKSALQQQMGLSEDGAALGDDASDGNAAGDNGSNGDNGRDQSSGDASGPSPDAPQRTLTFPDARNYFEARDWVARGQGGGVPPIPTRGDGALAAKNPTGVPTVDPKDPLAASAAMFRLFWRAEHYKDAFVLDTAPAAMELFAYHAAAPAWWSFLTSIFLHEGLEHLVGNMLFLWVFGRAVEDTLGHAFFAAAYFVCGFAATLLYHIMTIQFAPGSAAIHAFGASGAIAGVQGLFAPRFYRTPVRMFYTTFIGARIFYFATAVLGFILAKFMGSSGGVLAVIIVLAALVMMGEDDLWREWRVPAAWMITGWVVINDLVPALYQMMTNQQGGVAHWAHIGGLLCGVAYALLIGAQKEGKAEYFVDEARTSLDNKFSGNAIETAQKLLAMRPNDPVGYQLLAEAYDHKNDLDNALDNYEIAIAKYMAQNDRAAASALYLSALTKHQRFILSPDKQAVLAGEMARNSDWRNAAENMAKIPYTFPDAPESEVSLLRAAQMYAERLQEPATALQMLAEFQTRYPDSQWMAQVQRLRGIAQAQLNPSPQ